MDERVLAQVRELTGAEDDATTAARARAGDGVAPTPEVGALLRWLATTIAATSAVEIGSAAGVTGLWLVRGLRDKGMVTSIEPDPHAHGLATQAYGRSGAGNRVRAILSDPDEVLPRLSDGAYDIVLLQGPAFAIIDPLEHARRLLRPGGVLVARGLLATGDHAEARARFVQALADDPVFDAAILPLDQGLALATRGADDEPGTDEDAD